MLFEPSNTLTVVIAEVDGPDGALRSTIELTEEDRTPDLIGIDPHLVVTDPLETEAFAVLLENAPGPEGTVVDLILTSNDEENITSLFFPQDNLEQIIDVDAPDGPGQITITASLPEGETTSILSAQIPLGSSLILQEVFPNPEDEDGKVEWVSLYNQSAETIDLSQWSLGYGGERYTYGVYPLSGTINPGGCRIVGGPQSNERNFNPTLTQAIDFSPDLHNGGSNADAIGLFPIAADRLRSDSLPHDVLVYGGLNKHQFLNRDGEPLEFPQVDAPRPGQSIRRVTLGTWTLLDEPLPNRCGF